MLEKEIGRDQLNTINHSHSHDSAIDSDLQEWETEMVDLDIVSHKHLAYATEIKRFQLHDSIMMALPWDSINYITYITSHPIIHYV